MTEEEILAEIEAEAGGGSASTQGEQTSDDAVPTWRSLSAALPRQVQAILKTVHVVSLRLEALEEVEARVHEWNGRRRSVSGRTVPVGPGEARQAWNAMWNSRRAATLRTVRHVVDDTKHTAQGNKIIEHDVPNCLPASYANPRFEHGVLYAREPRRESRWYGVPSYLEATPIEAIVYVVRIWQDIWGKGALEVWDLTCGANTIYDLVTTVFQGRVFASDLTADASNTMTLDIRNLRTLNGRRQADIIFIDPPSRGSPTHARLYGGRTNADLARLDRREYVATLAQAVTDAFALAHERAWVCLLVREGRRYQQSVVPEPGLATEVVAAIDKDVAWVIERIEVRVEPLVRQASADAARCPMTLLVLGRGAEP